MIYNQGYETNYYDLYCEEKKRFKNVFFYWQCSLILGVATLVIFILLGFGPVDYYVTARPLITKSCVVGNCRKKGTQCFRLKAAAVTAWPFLLTLLLRALSCWSYGAVHCSNRINECYFTKKSAVEALVYPNHATPEGNLKTFVVWTTLWMNFAGYP